VIPNGVDQSVFHPGSLAEARHRLALPENAYVVLFAANGIRRSDFKDYKTLRDAIGKLGQAVTDRPILCVALGEAGEEERIGRARVRFIAPESDPAVVADYYRAADIYAHAAREDTFPSAVIEAMACGTPVVASEVGGIPEQIDHGHTGLLVPAGDAAIFSAYLAMVLRNPGLQQSFSAEGVKTVTERFNLETQAHRSLAWYRQVVRNVRSQGTRLAA
jgi:glycosyltransferase involved in cell wall biosynthesis